MLSTTAIAVPKHKTPSLFSSCSSRVHKSEDVIEDVEAVAVGKELEDLGVAHRSLFGID
jgi:hypothetical protein